MQNFPDFWVNEEDIEAVEQRAREVLHSWALYKRPINLGRSSYLVEVRSGADKDAIDFIFCKNENFREESKINFLEKINGGKLLSPVANAKYFKCPLCAAQT